MATEIKKYDINSIRDAYNSYLNEQKSLEDKTAKTVLKKYSTELENVKKEHEETNALYKQEQRNKKSNEEALIKISQELQSFLAQKENAEASLSTLTDEEEIARTNNFVAELTNKIESTAAQAKALDRDIKSNEFILENARKKYVNLSNEVKDLSEKVATAKMDLTTKQNKDAKSYDNLENFKKFLKKYKLSAVHADAVYELVLNPNKNITISKDEFTMRKMHPKRDFMIKKVAIPATIVGAVSGGVAGAVATSGTVAGGMAGFMPVFSSTAMNIVPSIALGFIVGAGATVGIIAAQKAIVKRIHKRNAKKDLKSFENGASIESLAISKLISKIEKDKHKVLELREGSNNIFARAFRKIRRNAINANNRDRLHALADYTIDLANLYNTYANDKSSDSALLAQKLKPIYQILSTVDEFIAKDISESKVYALLTCKESTDKHTHTNMIENVDIYAGLKIYLDRVNEIEDKREKKAQVKEAKRTTKNLIEKKNEATIILNDNERFIPQMLDYNKKYAKFATNDVKAVAVDSRTLNADNTITYNLHDGKSVTLKLSQVGIDEVSNIKATAKQTVITYADGSTKVIANAQPKKSSEEYIARHELQERLLNDSEFVAGLKVEYATQTIKKLIENLTTWLDDTTENSKLVLRGKVKELYNTAITRIENERKDALSAYTM